jgi:UDP-glucose:glycoprotein glucosyltransferase
MQFQLPIHTLDKSWLWCETWCSDASLAAAKTIDLCQNPAVKSTKLERARKIPEWTAYDDEVARLAQRLASQQLLADNIAASNETVALPVPESELQPEPEPALDAEPAPRHDEL